MRWGPAEVTDRIQLALREAGELQPRASPGSLCLQGLQTHDSISLREEGA